jgi:hypothetical protein
MTAGRPNRDNSAHDDTVKGVQASVFPARKEHERFVVVFFESDRSRFRKKLRTFAFSHVTSGSSG